MYRNCLVGLFVFIRNYLMNWCLWKISCDILCEIELRVGLKVSKDVLEEDGK